MFNRGYIVYKYSSNKSGYDQSYYIYCMILLYTSSYFD